MGPPLEGGLGTGARLSAAKHLGMDTLPLRIGICARSISTPPPLKIGRRTDASPQLPAAKNPVPSATFSYATDKTGSTNTKGPAGLT
jgi:hypothetical protein